MNLVERATELLKSGRNCSIVSDDDGEIISSLDLKIDGLRDQIDAFCHKNTGNCISIFETAGL